MDLPGIRSLVRTLESDTESLPAFHDQLVDTIAWLMDKTFESTDGDEKVRLAATELRARGVLERYRKADVN